MHYLTGAITYDPTVTKIDGLLASKIVWLDCFITNVDRTVRNTNMLVWQSELWLIDHGASLFFHHSWDNAAAQAIKPFTYVKDHVLLPLADDLQIVNDDFIKILTSQKLIDIVGLIPDEWLLEDSPFKTISEHREAYAHFLINRLANTEIFLNEAIHARETVI